MAGRGRAVSPLRRAGDPNRNGVHDEGPAGGIGSTHYRLSPRPPRSAAGDEIPALVTVCFNPHRPVKAGASGVTRSPDITTTVSILTGPLRPVLRHLSDRWPAFFRGVSILTGPLRPVLQWCDALAGYHNHGFNPHRPVKAGASFIDRALVDKS